MSAWDLVANARETTEENDDLALTLNWVGIAHLMLPTAAFLNFLVLILTNHCVFKRGYNTVLTNMWIIAMCGQMTRCFGRQTQYIYYPYFGDELRVIGIIFMQNIGVYLIDYVFIMLGVTYYYIGIKENYAFYQNTVFPKIFPIAFIIILIIWMIAACYNIAAAAVINVIFSIGGTNFHTIMYYKLRNIACQEREYRDENSKIIFSISKESATRLYYIGLFGSVLESIIFTILAPVGVSLNYYFAWMRFLAVVLVGTVYTTMNIALHSLETMAVFQNILHKKNQNVQNTEMAHDTNLSTVQSSEV